MFLSCKKVSYPYSKYILFTNLELLQNIILYQLYSKGHVTNNVSTGKRSKELHSSEFICSFLNQPLRHMIPTMIAFHLNTKLRNFLHSI